MTKFYLTFILTITLCFLLGCLAGYKAQKKETILELQRNEAIITLESQRDNANAENFATIRKALDGISPCKVQ